MTSGLVGYHIFEADPFAHSSDPGFRFPIFALQNTSTNTIAKGITAAFSHKCDMSVNTEVYNNFHSYVQGKKESMTKSTSFQLGREAEVTVIGPGPPGAGLTTYTRKIQPLLSSQFGESRTTESIRKRMTEEDLTLMTSTASCEQY